MGASSGIGEALALKFDQLESKVILSSRRENELERIKELSLHPENIKILPLDLLDSASFKEKTEQAFSLFGTIDYVFINGGTSSRGYVSDTVMEVHQRIMDLNYFSYVGLTREILPFFKKQGNGHFVVTSSVMGKIGSLCRSAYAASKHALHGFYDCLRAEVAEDNIRVTILTPGYIITNISLYTLTADGSPNRKESKNIDSGLPAGMAADQIIKAVGKNKNEAFIGKKFRAEHFSLYLMRFFPDVLHKVVRKFKPE